MPFVPHGKKAGQRRAGEVRREADERVIARVVDRAQFAVRHAPGRALPLCVLVERTLARELPFAGYALVLGALRVVPRGAASDPISFDPRRSDGSAPGPGVLPANEAFHAWLETPRGRLLDPSLFPTLHAGGYHVEREGYVLAEGRDVVRFDLQLHYEELPELSLVGVEESAEYLAKGISFIQKGFPLDLGASSLGVAWG